MLTKLLAGKPLLILILATSLGSFAAGAALTNVVWDRKHTKYQLSVEQSKSKFLADAKAEQEKRFDEYAANYNAALEKVSEIVLTRDSAVEASNQKYRSLYVAYTRLQNAQPATPESDIDAERSALLLQSVYQANQTRNEFAASRINQAKN